jgi:hypothetical protein
MTVERMASPGALKHRPVLDSDTPDALGRKKGGNRWWESSASARGARRNEKLPRAAFLPCAPPAHAAFCSRALSSSRALFFRVRCLLLPRVALLPCLLLPRAAFCSHALPSSHVLFSRAHCLLLPRAAFYSFAPARCPLLQRALSSALPCALPSALNRAPSSLVRQLPLLLVDGKRRRRRILLIDGKRILLALCSRTALLLVPGYAPLL